MIYYADIPDNLVNPAQTALIANYGSNLNSATVIQGVGTTIHTSSTITIDLNDDTITSDDVSAVLTNALGQYVGVSATAPSGGINAGDFLNAWGDAIRKFLASLKLPSLPSLWWIVAIALILIFAGIFTFSSGKGFGASVGARV